LTHKMTHKIFFGARVCIVCEQMTDVPGMDFFIYSTSAAAAWFF
jgi:hypothetical protein